MTAPLEAVGGYLGEEIILQRGRQAIEQPGLVFARKVSNGLGQRSKGHIQILTGKVHFIKVADGSSLTMQYCRRRLLSGSPYSRRGRPWR